MEAKVDKIEPDPTGQKRCFVVSAFGSTPEEVKRTKQVLRHLVRKVLEPHGYRVVRADEIDEEGLITNQIIERLLEDELVVADLSGANPNVFYEIAVRHAARKPIVHLITAGERIPFDVANMRTISYALDDPDLLELAQEQLARKVAAIESSDGAGPNPISAARDVWLLRGSDEPDVREAGELLAAVSDLRDEMRSLSRRVAATPREVGRWQPFEEGWLEGPLTTRNRLAISARRDVLRALALRGPLTMAELDEQLGYGPGQISRALTALFGQGKISMEGREFAVTRATLDELIPEQT